MKWIIKDSHQTPHRVSQHFPPDINSNHWRPKWINKPDPTCMNCDGAGRVGKFPSELDHQHQGSARQLRLQLPADPHGGGPQQAPGPDLHVPVWGDRGESHYTSSNRGESIHNLYCSKSMDACKNNKNFNRTDWMSWLLSGSFSTASLLSVDSAILFLTAVQPKCNLKLLWLVKL